MLNVVVQVIYKHIFFSVHWSFILAEFKAIVSLICVNCVNKHVSIQLLFGSTLALTNCARNGGLLFLLQVLLNLDQLVNFVHLKHVSLQLTSVSTLALTNIAWERVSLQNRPHCRHTETKQPSSRFDRRNFDMINNFPLEGPTEPFFLESSQRFALLALVQLHVVLQV